MMPRWHHSDSSMAMSTEHNSVKKKTKKKKKKNKKKKTNKHFRTLFQVKGHLCLIRCKKIWEDEIFML